MEDDELIDGEEAKEQDLISNLTDLHITNNDENTLTSEQVINSDANLIPLFQENSSASSSSNLMTPTTISPHQNTENETKAVSHPIENNKNSNSEETTKKSNSDNLEEVNLLCDF